MLTTSVMPVVIKPQHFVDEIGQITQKELQRRRTEARRVLGKASHTIHLYREPIFTGRKFDCPRRIGSQFAHGGESFGPSMTSRAKEFVG